MARFISFLNPSLVDQEGLHKYLTRLFGPGVATSFNANGWKVTQRGAGANMSVDVAVGDGLLARPSGDYGFWGWTTATENIAVTAANPTNPRIDTVVAWIDTSVTTTGSANSPNALKFQIMAGTPAGSPVAMPDVTIQSTLGAAAAWIKLATINVAAGSTSVVNANITDARTGINVTAPLPANSVNGAVVLQDNSVTAAKLDWTTTSLGKATKTTDFATGSTYPNQIPGLSINITVPNIGRSTRIVASIPAAYSSTVATMTLSIWDGTVGSGTKIDDMEATTPVADHRMPMRIDIPANLSAGAHTINVGFHTNSGTAGIRKMTGTAVLYAEVF
ncbi:hypothetical protein [Mycolicibacterium porcinum]|uniref:hypothetical protein n=1 Tax=Mycolicibacterium porcinum TaxID=39693 RepID=UPI001041CBE3|nr:hypothetical protein [Mycolicibacterium porcinum]